MVECETASAISHFFSTFSLISWMCAQLPQIYTNYVNKSAEGISPSFLLLWFMGDFLSFTSCLLNDSVLAFQVYLSLFFICNDIVLCYQFYYYNHIYPKLVIVSKSQEEEVVTGPMLAGDADIHAGAGTIHIRSHIPAPEEADEWLSLTPPSDSSIPSSYNSINGKRQSTAKVVSVASILNAGASNAMSISHQVTTAVGITATTTEEKIAHHGTFALILAWSCTAVYVSSRCPQLYKNYKRKSVEGVSPLLFGAALFGNLAYTISVLTSCEFLLSSDKTTYFWHQLPYLIGSSGTIVFDFAYFYQRHIYRNSHQYSTVVGLEPWDNIEGGHNNA